jgi:hypothetical protein
MNLLALGTVLLMALLIGAGESSNFFPTHAYETTVFIASAASSLLIFAGYLFYLGRRQLKMKTITDALLLALFEGVAFFMILTGIGGSIFTKFAGATSSISITGKTEFNARSFSCSHLIRSEVVPSKYANSKICVPKDFYVERGHSARYQLDGRSTEAGFVVNLITLSK